jgi:hypothetical protein
VIGGILALIALVAGLIAAWQTFVQASSIVVTILIVIVGILTPLAALGLCAHVAVSFYRKHQREQLQTQREQLDLALARQLGEAEVERLKAQTRLLDAETDVKRRTINFDGIGNAAVIDSYGQIVQLHGNYQQHPNLSSLHYSIKNDAPPAIGAPAQNNLLTGTQRELPKVEMFYELIPYNSLQTAMGIEAMSGNPVIVGIRKSTHFKLIGGSGLGKSCLAAGILDIATTTNEPDHLKIGLLDLEHNTSRLFEHLPHIAELGPRRQRLVGCDPEEVAQKLKLLQWELSRRAELGEEHCRLHEPVLLVYVEEMLALKYEVVDEKLNKEMLAAITILGVRARKYGIFLLVCMQIDYSDKSTREAMAQFRTRAGFAVDPDAARASGFFNTELVKQNFLAGRSGQYVLEKPQYSNLVLAHDYDVATKLEQLSAPSAAPTEREKIRLIDVTSRTPEGESEGASEGAARFPLQSAPKANAAPLSAQEQRIIRKFLQEGMGISQIVASEYTNARGEPLTSGELYKQRSKEVQEIIRRYVASQAS